MTLFEEAPKGRLAGLIALRDKLAAEIDTAEQARDVASLSRQFSDVLLQIDELDVAPAACRLVSVVRMAPGKIGFLTFFMETRETCLEALGRR